MDVKFVLNTGCLAMASVCKWSPLYSAINTKRVLGLSLISFFLETLSLSITFSYFLANDYDIFDFMDYPVLLLQNVLLIMLYVLFERPQFLSFFVGGLAIYLSVVYGLATRTIPFEILQLLASSTLFISSSSKVAQMRDLVVNRRGDLVSKGPWAIFALTSAARITTVYLETADAHLLRLYGLSVVLNAMVIVFTELFKPKKEAKKVEFKKK